MSRKVVIVAVKGPFTMLHRESFLMFPAAAAHARASSVLLNLCSKSSPWGRKIHVLNKDKMASANDEIDHPFILLHLFFDTAWTAGLLKREFFGDYDTCADFWKFGRGSPASSSTSLPPWTLGSHSFEDGACRTTRRWRVVLAPKLAVRSVLEQLVWLRNNDKMERFIFFVIRKA